MIYLPLCTRQEWPYLVKAATSLGAVYSQEISMKHNTRFKLLSPAHTDEENIKTTYTL
jgi:hypothetical protein